MSGRIPLQSGSFSETFQFPNRELAERAVILTIKILKGDIKVYKSLFWFLKLKYVDYTRTRLIKLFSQIVKKNF